MRVIGQRRAAGEDPPPRHQGASNSSPALLCESGLGFLTSTFALHRFHLLLGQSQLVQVNPLRSFITDPDVLFILFGLAAICIFIELSHPGAIVPGTVGAITLVVFLFGAVALSPNWEGLILMLLAVMLLAVEVRLPSHGALALVGLASLVVGSLIFFDTGTDQHASTVNTYVVLGVAVGVGLVSLVVIRYAIMSRRAPMISGTQGLLGQIGQVTVPLTPGGRVKVQGEDWAAELAPEEAIFDMTIPADHEVRITAYDGLKLIVEPIAPMHDDILGLLLRHRAFKTSGKPVEPIHTPVVEGDQPVQEP
ncbi:MAG: NfeD family protein [Ktedonobacterales bacterium]